MDEGIVLLSRDPPGPPQDNTRTILPPDIQAGGGHLSCVVRQQPTDRPRPVVRPAADERPHVDHGTGLPGTQVRRSKGYAPGGKYIYCAKNKRII